MNAAEISAVHEERGLNLRQADIDRFRAENVPGMALVKAALGDWSLVLRARVDRLQSGGFEFADPPDSGTVAFTIVALDELGTPADIVAWRPGMAPATWLNRVGLLGQEMIYAPRLDEPLAVFDDVLDWFRAGRDGVMIVDRIRGAPLLREAGRLQVSTHAHRRRLKALLTVPPPLIEVRSSPAPALQAAE